MHATRAISKADLALKAEQQAQYVKDLWIFLASVVALLAVFRALRFLVSIIFRPNPRPARTQPEKGCEEVLPDVQTRKFSFRRIPSAFASTFRVVAFRTNIPIGPGAVASAAELLFIIGYIVAMLTFTLIDTEGLQTWFFEDRAAHLASCQLPLVVALAGKNNILSFLTGVSHEKLNVLHRASARTCLLFLWMHAISRASAGLPDKFDFTHGWMRWGATGLVAFTLAAILSVRPVRNAFFEFFLISHIILIGVFLIGGYLHTREPGFGDYIWPALVIWAFDRVLRGARLMWNNRFGLSKHYSTASVELISSDTMRLTLRRRFNWKPGQHAYVILPTVSGLPTEAHPFTIASISQSLDGQNTSSDKEVVFLIRGREGFTGRLLEHASANGSSTVPALVDGPYGCPPDLSKYSTCILVAGGSGVSYILPLLLDIVRKARLQQSSVQRVVFLWAVRDADHIRWISQILGEALDAAQSTSLIIDPRIYLTCATSSTPSLPIVGYEDSDNGSVNAESPVSEKKIGLPNYSALRIMSGRPAIRKILHEEISASTGPVSVDVAGPSNLSQSVAKALSSGIVSPHNVLRGSPSVDLHVETFGMTR